MATSESVDQYSSSDATLAMLGFEYQKLVALQYCLESRSGDIVYLECFGDIATSDASIETKHHASDSILTNQSPDFWKTLRNHVRNRIKLSQFTRLVLHTTSRISDDSIFRSWNELSGEEKYNRLETVRVHPNKGIMDFVKDIYNFNDAYTRKDLIAILERVQIYHLQKTADEIFSEIKDHQYFFVVKEIYRKELIRYLHGVISLKAIENKYRWEIIISDFLSDLRSHMQRYCRDEIPFPDILENVKYTGSETFPFITELKAVDLDSEVQKAFIDFIRAEKSSMELLKRGAYTMQESIDVFESELKERMDNYKKRHALTLVQSDLQTPKSILKSKELYFDCKIFEKHKICGVQEIQMYYQHGKMHKIVNDRKFVWQFLPREVA